MLRYLRLFSPYLLPYLRDLFFLDKNVVKEDQLNRFYNVFSQITTPNIINLIESEIAKYNDTILSSNSTSKKLDYSLTTNFKKKVKIDFPYVGIEVGYIFKNNMLLTLGAGWYQNYNINYSLESETETLYSYGKTQVMESIVLNKMYWLEIPIKISYPISTKSRVGFGAAYSQLLGGKSTYSRQDIFTDYSSSEVTSTEMSDIYNGYSDKISTKNYSILSSYQYQYNKFGTELKYYYGLNNLINEEEIKNNRVTLTIKYSIF